MYFDKFVQARAGIDLDLQHTVLSEEVISYTNEWNEILTAQSYNSRVVPLKLFLQNMNDVGIIRTEIAALENIRTSGKGTKPKQ